MLPGYFCQLKARRVFFGWPIDAGPAAVFAVCCVAFGAFDCAQGCLFMQLPCFCLLCFAGLLL
jgi:hypothetical protein